MQDRTAKELEAKLERKGFPEEVIGKILEDMTTLGYLNDERLAQRFAENGAEGRGLGPRRVRAELARRGVPGDVIEQAVCRVYEGDREGVLAIALARKWVERRQGLGDEGVARRRLYGFLARRGFSPDVIERALREALD